MTAFAEPISKEEKKYIQIMTSEDDHEFLKLLSDDSNLPQGAILHILMQMMALCVTAAREMGKVDDELQIPMIEQYTVQILRHLGLLTDEEYARALIASDAMGSEKTNVRLQVLQGIANERLTELRPLWAKEREAGKMIREWNAKKAAQEALDVMSN